MTNRKISSLLKNYFILLSDSTRALQVFLLLCMIQTEEYSQSYPRAVQVPRANESVTGSSVLSKLF